MKQLLLLLLGMLAASAVRAQTAIPRSTQFYIQPSALIVFPGDFDTVAGAALAVGTTIADRHSGELEVIHFNTRDDGVRVIFNPLLANYKFRLPVNDTFSWYAGGSIGATLEDARVWGGSINRTVFTYGVQGGVSYALTPRLALDLGGRVLRLQESGITTEGNIAMLNASLRFRF